MSAPLPRLKNTIDYMQLPRTEFTKFSEIFTSGTRDDDALLYDISFYDYEGLAHSTKLPMIHSAYTVIVRAMFPEFEPLIAPSRWSFVLRKADHGKFRMNIVNTVTSKEFYIALVE